MKVNTGTATGVQDNKTREMRDAKIKLLTTVVLLMQLMLTLTVKLLQTAKSNENKGGDAAKAGAGSKQAG